MAAERSEASLGSSPKRPRLEPEISISTTGAVITKKDDGVQPQDILESGVGWTGKGNSSPVSERTIETASPIVQPQPTVCDTGAARPGPSGNGEETTTLDPGVRSTRVVSVDWPGTSSEMMSPTGEGHSDQGDEWKHDDNEIDSDLDLGLGNISPEPISGPMGWLHHKMLTGVDPRTILARILPPDFSLPSDMTDLEMWGLIAEYFKAFQEPEKRKKLPDVNTFEDAISLLRRCSNIIVLSGAGVSVSCGIPDFRSRDGIYARLAVDFPDLPDPQAMFDIHYFRKDPRPFFKFAKEIYPGQYKPSICHKFISLLERNKKLLRNYSQNIDTLEQVAGITKVLQCHGSFATATCTNCGYKVDAEVIREDIFNQVVPKCPRCNPDLGVQAILKPDIVFFGEGLPSVFYDCLDQDKRLVDLLIVIGSSLKVRPVATIPYPSVVANSIPQILINREPLPHMNFDIELLGDGDVIINEICHRLGEGWDHICSVPERLREVTEIPRPPVSEEGILCGLPGNQHEDDQQPRPSGVKAEDVDQASSVQDDSPGHLVSSGVGSGDQATLSEGTGRGCSDGIAGNSLNTAPSRMSELQNGKMIADSAISEGKVDVEGLVGRTASNKSGNNDERTEVNVTGNKSGNIEMEVSGDGKEFESIATPPDLKMCDDENKFPKEVDRTEQSGSVETTNAMATECLEPLSRAKRSTSDNVEQIVASSEVELKSQERSHTSKREQLLMEENSITSSHSKTQGQNLESDGSNISGSLDRHPSSTSASQSNQARGDDLTGGASSSREHAAREKKARPRRQSITEHMEASTYLFIPPNRYVFHGAEVYLDDSSDGEEVGKAGDNPSTDELHSMMGSDPHENRAPSQYSHGTSSSECSMLSPDSTTDPHVGVPPPSIDTSSSQELSTADL